MGAVERLLEMAGSQVGYMEKSLAAVQADPSVLDDFKRGAGLDNYTKYARDQWKVRYFNGQKQGVAWCAVFVGWCFLQCFGKDAALRLQCQPRSGNAGAGCGAASKYYKQKGRFSSVPAVGDQIFFRNGEQVSHTGIVEKVGSGKVWTIEGNSDGMVARHSYRIDNGRIYGYGHPDWSIVEPGGSDPSEDLSEDLSGDLSEDLSGEKKSEDEDEKETMEKRAKVVRTSTSTGSTVNLRAQASTGGKILEQIPFGTEVKVTEDRGTWCKVTYQGTSGWMMSNYIEYTGESDEGEDGYQVMLSLDEINTIEGALRKLEETGKQIDSVLEEIGTIIGRG